MIHIPAPVGAPPVLPCIGCYDECSRDITGGRPTIPLPLWVCAELLQEKAIWAPVSHWLNLKFSPVLFVNCSGNQFFAICTTSVRLHSQRSFPSAGETVSRTVNASGKKLLRRFTHSKLAASCAANLSFNITQTTPY